MERRRGGELLVGDADTQAPPTLGIVALALNAGMIATGAAPFATLPVADVELAAGSTLVGAIDVSAHFDSGGGQGVAYRALAVPGPAGDAPDLVVIRIRGATADILAPETSRTGAARFQFEACAPAAEGCALTNVFEVRVRAPSFGRPDFN